MPPWVREYIGIPFRPLGRDRTGVDCYGLVRLVYLERFALQWPEFAGIGWPSGDRAARAAVAETMAAQAPILGVAVETPVLGDAVLMRMGALATHVGLYLGGGRMLHVERGCDSVHESIVTGPLRDRPRSFWRPAEWVDDGA